MSFRISKTSSRQPLPIPEPPVRLESGSGRKLSTVNRESAAATVGPKQARFDVHAALDRSASARWALAPALVTVASAIDLLLQAYNIRRPTPEILLAAIVITVWYAGAGPGLLAVLLSILSLAYFFLPPSDSLVVARPDLLYFASFVFFALLTDWFSSVRRRTERSLEVARSDLEIKVAERTAELQRRNQTLQLEIAERKRAEQNLQEAKSQLAHAGRLTAMGELTASIAHEINQPLAAIVANADACTRFLAGPTVDLGEVRDAVSDIAEAGTRAGEVIARIRAFLRKAPVAEHCRVDLNGVIQEVLELTRSELERHEISVRCDLDSGLPGVQGDRVELQQVILNLVMNGIEAMLPDTSRPRLLVIHSQSIEGESVRVTISDSGIGLRPETLSRLFDPFFTTKPNGLGLGLAISRSIVESHGGRLWALEGTGPGAAFRFTLPACSPETR